MTKTFIKFSGLFVVMFFTAFNVFSQNTIKGKVKDQSDVPILGINVQVVGTLVGTMTNFDGKFKITTSKEIPFVLKFSYIGYATKLIKITKANQNITVILEEQAQSLDKVVVSSASKFSEKILEAPVTIEKVGIAELRSTPSFDAYGAINNLKGIQSNTGSLTFTSINTRGFADMQNFRFVQLIDGMYAAAPGLGYAVGGNSGPADIDISSIEIVPGANSALYGANAFNGLLTVKTKDPFYYQGISAYFKGGVTAQDAGGTNALNDVGFRYAKAFNDKFAFKINGGYLTGTDWEANDESYYINTSRSFNPEPYLSIPRNDPNFDAVNVYGDEVRVQVDLDGSGTTTPINRTGIKERDIIDYNVEVIKFDASVHYRISDDLEASYGYRFIESDAILRHTTIYPLKNFRQTFSKFQLKSINWDLKAYISKENANDSYALLATGAFIEEGRKSSVAWGADYGKAFRGEVTGIASGNHDLARIYADRDLPSVDSPEFKALREATLSNSDISSGGSKFIDNTSLTSFEGNYNFDSFKDVVSLQVGASYRSYNLNSEGQLFNDGPLGFGEPIPINEYGAYLQAGKKFANNRLHLRGSLRADKHQDFDLKFTPRLSLVASLDKDKLHNIRTSYQTGFRNPSPQEGYINLDIGPAILLGGIENNINNFSFKKPDGTIINGTDIFDNLVTLASFRAFAGGGFTDPSLLKPANLSLLKQEKNTTWEIGYKGKIGKKLFLDVNYYNTVYSDLIVRLTTVSPQAGKAFAVYTNIDDKITSNGFGFGLDYSIGNGYKAGFNYTYTSFDAKDAVANTPGFLPSFNTPENRINFTFSGTSIGKTNIGFNLKYKHWDAYTWQSPFGAGKVDAQGILDLALSYRVKKMQSIIKLGATNLLNNNYRTVYGGPEIGSIVYIGWTYDQIFGK